MIYDQMTILVDGKLLVEMVSVDLTLDKTDQDIFTVTRPSLSGVSPGPSKAVGTVENVVPVTGFDFDAWDSALSTKEHAVEYIQMGSGKSMSSVATARAVKLSSGVGKAQAYNFEFHGSANPWK